MNGGTSTAMFSVQVKNNNAGAPGNLVASLSDPVANGVGFPLFPPDFATFTAPTNTTLAANTTYWVVVNELRPSSDDGRLKVHRTDSDNESGETATGWSIGNGSLSKPTASDDWTDLTSSLRIVVKGAATPVTSDVTLSAIKLTGTRLNREVRPQHLVADTYTGFIPPTVSTLTVAPETSDTGATVEYLSASDAALTDTDTSTDALDLAVAEGLTVIKVKVTSSDTTATRTYTLRIVRAHGAPVQDANALMTSYLTPTANTRYKGFYALRGATSGWMSHRWVQKAQADGIGARIRIDALMSVDNSFTSGDGQRFRANTIAVCFIPSAEIETGLRLEIGGRAFWLAEGRHFRRGAQCWEWDRPADMSWSLGQRVTVRAYKDGALSGGANHPAMGHPAISGVPRVGETLTAETGTMADEDGLPATFEYQWLAIDGESETELTGETSQTYVAAERVTGTRMVAVRVSFDDERGFRETRTSLPVAITAPTYGTGVVQPKEETLWSGQLTPVSTGTGTTGCDNDGGATQACSTTTILSDDEMTNREGTNDVVLIENTAGAVEDLELKFGGTGLDVRIGTNERHMALLVGNQRLPLADARKVAAGHYVWAQTNISLAAGTPVEMKLVRKTVTATITRLRGLERHVASGPLFQFSVKFDRFVAVDRATLATQFSGPIGTSMVAGVDFVEPVGHNYVTNVNGEARTVAREFRLYMLGQSGAEHRGVAVTVTLTPRPCANGGICTAHGVRVTQSASAVLGQNGDLQPLSANMTETPASFGITVGRWR